MNNSIITGIHYCIPTKTIGNPELIERFGERQLKSIVKMAGIKERRVVSAGETAADLAYCAATRLFAAQQIDPQSIDLLIFASQTGDHQIPATACILHGKLGLSTNCAAFDLNLGCTSYPYTLSVAHSMLVAGVATKALLLNADALTTVIHPLDRGLVPLHGDGAVATILEATSSSAGFAGFLLGTDGTGAQHLSIPASGARIPRSDETKQEVTDESGITRTLEHLHMNGPAVFHFSVYQVPTAINAALAKFQLTIADIDLVILHQANKMMMDLIYKALEVPPEKRFYFMETVGNTSGASTPMALAEAWRQQKIQPGTKTLLASFGVGLSWGVTVINWPADVTPSINAEVDYLASSEQANAV
jgi:3-oxoacyl-[acyl-carrier-protein] synthase III